MPFLLKRVAVNLALPEFAIASDAVVTPAVRTKKDQAEPGLSVFDALDSAKYAPQPLPLIVSLPLMFGLSFLLWAAIGWMLGVFALR